MWSKCGSPSKIVCGEMFWGRRVIRKSYYLGREPTGDKNLSDFLKAVHISFKQTF